MAKVTLDDIIGFLADMEYIDFPKNNYWRIIWNNDERDSFSTVFSHKKSNYYEIDTAANFY